MRLNNFIQVIKIAKNNAFVTEVQISSFTSS